LTLEAPILAGHFKAAIVTVSVSIVYRIKGVDNYYLLKMAKHNPSKE